MDMVGMVVVVAIVVVVVVGFGIAIVDSASERRGR